MSGLEIQDVWKSFGEKRALAGVSLCVSQQEIVAVLGPSGCGKSTLLGIIAGLEVPDQGSISWEGISLADKPAHQRGFGLMFQDFALFPHLNVFENVAFGLRMAKQSDDQVQEGVRQALELAGLPGFERRDVNTLSGGEQQRVALARSLAPKPRLLMLDEPLGALDRALRERLVLDLRSILRSSHQTAIYVTHDQEEAFTLADRVIVMNAGKVEQIGTPQEIYTQPGSAFVARFLGMENLLAGTVQSGDDGKWSISTALGLLPLDGVSGIESLLQEQRAIVLVRPDALQFAENRLDVDGFVQLQARMAEVTFRGSMQRASFVIGDIFLSGEFSSQEYLPRVGEQVWLRFAPHQALQIFKMGYLR